MEITIEDLGLKAGQRFTYTDDWRHTVKVESFMPMLGPYDFGKSPALLAGERAAPQEDTG